MSATSEHRLEPLRDETLARAERIPDTPVHDPRGGLTTIGTLVTDGARVRASVLAEREAGSEEHRRISRGQRVALRLLPLLDGPVMFWFLIGVLNVDLREPDATMLVALALALLCTVAVAAWVGTVGAPGQDADAAVTVSATRASSTPTDGSSSTTPTHASARRHADAPQVI